MKHMWKHVAAAVTVCSLAAAPALAQSSSGTGSGSGSGATDQAGSKPGGHDPSGQSGAKSGTRGGAATGTQSDQGAQSTAGTSGTRAADTAKGTSADRTFIVEAAADGMAEIQLGQLAGEKASRAEVKQLAKTIVQDHQQANDQLMKIAQGKQLAAPHAVKPEQQAAYERLSKLSGAEFDRAYVSQMVKEHQKAVTLFRKQSQAASDPELKQFASSTLPKLEHHLQQAEQLNRQVAGTSGSSAQDAKTKSGAGSTSGAGSKSGTSGGGSSSGSGTGAGNNPPPPQR